MRTVVLGPFSAAILLLGSVDLAAQAPDVCSFLSPPQGARIEPRGNACTWSRNFPSEAAQPGYLSVTLTRYDASGEACAVLARLQNGVARESRATMSTFDAPGWERTFAMSAPQHDSNPARYAVGGCYESYLLFAAALNPSRGRLVPIDIQDDAKASFEVVRARLVDARAVSSTASEAERDLVDAIGFLGQSIDAVRDRLEGNVSEAAWIERRRAVDAVELELRERVRARGGDPSGVDRQLVERLRVVATLAQQRDRSASPAFPSLRQSLPIMLQLATTAAVHPDPAVAHQAQTALGRYSAMVFRLDADALVLRSPNR